MKRSKDRPYILFVAEIIYSKIFEIKLKRALGYKKYKFS